MEEKRKLKLNTGYVADIKPERDIQKHKKFFALLRIAWENLPERFDRIYPDYRNSFRKAVQMMAGHTDQIILPNGLIQDIPKSIDFESMDDAEFKDLYNRCVDVILQHFLKGTDNVELQKQIAENF
jgi:hypothetical protein